jgi:hypothetical protein
VSRTTGHVDATFYAQVEPEWGYAYAGDEDKPLRAAKVANVTQKRPTHPKPGTVLVKLTLRIPAAAFYPLRPEAIIIVPESLTEATPVEAIADDPHADGGDQS